MAIVNLDRFLYVVVLYRSILSVVGNFNLILIYGDIYEKRRLNERVHAKGQRASR
jgi:hypothetical protein